MLMITLSANKSILTYDRLGVDLWKTGPAAQYHVIQFVPKTYAECITTLSFEFPPYLRSESRNSRIPNPDLNTRSLYASLAIREIHSIPHMGIRVQYPMGKL